MQASYRENISDSAILGYDKNGTFEQYDPRTGEIFSIIKFGVDKHSVEILGTTSINDETDFVMVGKAITALAQRYQDHIVTHRLYDDVNAYFGYFIMWGFQIVHRIVAAVNENGKKDRKGYTLALHRNTKRLVPPVCEELDGLRSKNPFIDDSLLSI